MEPYKVYIRNIAWVIGGLVLLKNAVMVIIGFLFYGFKVLLPSFSDGNVTPYFYIYAISYFISIKNTLLGGVLLIIGSLIYMNYSIRFGLSLFPLQTLIMATPGVMLISIKFLK